ncbi:hypothetical protein L1987_33544 [Smallanthus sonchifolius]|uniref:Uncharacterized protein n=1 Tax=Smallanthus sonchifolius TaxID=185202 RepID=A0ACB9HSJ4_9ASTR|nr:hypothetical protein L1987_33544 [Smallanthus sonchifolius]
MICFDAGFNDSPPQSLSGTRIFAGYNKSTRIFDIHCAGIISSIAFSPSHTGMLARGSCSQTTSMHRKDNMEQLYVQFSKDGNYLYIEGRKVVSGSLYDEAAVMVIYAVILDCKLMLEESTNNYG